MCRGCWEGYEDQRVDTPAVQELAEDISEFLGTFPGGGGLHIVLEDWNLDADNVRWCQSEGVNYGWNDLADSICTQMLAMSEVERASALALAEGYW